MAPFLVKPSLAVSSAAVVTMSEGVSLALERTAALNSLVSPVLSVAVAVMNDPAPVPIAVKLTVAFPLESVVVFAAPRNV